MRHEKYVGHKTIPRDYNMVFMLSKKIPTYLHYISCDLAKVSYSRTIYDKEGR